MIVSLIWLLFSALVALASLRIDVGTLHAPGPGFLTFYTAVLLGFLSLITVFQAWKGPGIRAGSSWKASALWKTGLLLTVLFFYVGLFSTVGFLAATFILLLFLFRLVEPLRWTTVFLASGLTVTATYFIFGILLGNKLPQGPWGF
jgi:putative tricarboxylic transport membrane protein